MKIILIRLLSITFLLLGMNACVGPVGPAYGGGGYYDSGYSDGPTYIVDNDVAYYDTYGHYSSAYRPGYTRYYGRYDRYGHRDSHGYYSRSGHDLRSHSSSSNHSGSHSSPSRSTSSSQLYTHKSSDNNRGAPQGQHSQSWYKSRGYGVSKLLPASSSHSNSSHGSSHSKKDDDDHHKHH